MTEYYAVYDVASGDFIAGGFGPPGAAAIQVLAEGRAVAVVPQAALLPNNGFDLVVVKQQLRAQVDWGAEDFRQGFITPGAGQALTYQYKAEEAKAYSIDPAAPTPFLAQEAEDMETTVAALAAEVLGQVAAWTMIGKRIEGRRRRTNRDVEAATNLGGALAAARVDWLGLLAP